jgi:aromatic ring-opening dioxygenase catalytic subunit (LigB family)
MDWTRVPADTWNPTRRFLEGVAARWPAPPKAMVVVSSHWEEAAFTASAAPTRALIFDYSGFPDQHLPAHLAGSGIPRIGALLAEWRQAPFATDAHPREEHLIPLMVAAGSRGEAPGKRVFTDESMGAAISAYRFDS